MARPPKYSSEQILDALVSTFRGLNGLTEGSITSAEMARIDELVEQKFGTEEWTARVP